MTSRGWGPIAAIGALVALGLPNAAEAKLFDIYADARAGEVAGWGLNSINSKASDFFERVRGPGVGAQVGMELLLVNLSVNFFQLFDKAGAAGTLTQFLIGFDGEIGIDDCEKSRTFLRLGVAGGVALGTHRPVDPPLDNNQVSNKGPVLQATVALEHHLNRAFTVGFELTPGYHYFFAGGDAPANDKTNQSQGIHLMGLLTLRLHYEPGS